MRRETRTKTFEGKVETIFIFDRLRVRDGVGCGEGRVDITCERRLRGESTIVTTWRIIFLCASFN